MCEKARKWERYGTFEDQETEVECSRERGSLLTYKQQMGQTGTTAGVQQATILKSLNQSMNKGAQNPQDSTVVTGRFFAQN